MLNFSKRNSNIVMKVTSIWNIRVNTFFERKLTSTTNIITLPVSSSSRTFAPVFFHIVTVYNNLICWTFFKS